jgi:hypothetical protein
MVVMRTSALQCVARLCVRVCECLRKCVSVCLCSCLWLYLGVSGCLRVGMSGRRCVGCVCVCVSMAVCVRAYVSVCLMYSIVCVVLGARSLCAPYTCAGACAFACVSVCGCVRVCVSLCLCVMWVCVRMHVCMYVWVFV